LINGKIAEILDHLDQTTCRLRAKAVVSLQEYLSQWELRDVIEREMEKAVQCCTDAGARLIALRGFRRARDNHDIFDVLAEQGVLPRPLAARLRELVGLRNLLAHEYRRIEDEKVFRHFQDCPALCEQFARAVATYLA